MKRILFSLIVLHCFLAAQEEDRPTSVSVNIERREIDTSSTHEFLNRVTAIMKFENNKNLDAHQLELLILRRKLYAAMVTAGLGFAGTIVTFFTTYFGASCG